MMTFLHWSFKDFFEQVVAVGWGTTSSGGSVSTALRQVMVSTIAVTASMCSSVLNDPRRQLCAGIQCGGRGAFQCKC